MTGFYYGLALDTVYSSMALGLPGEDAERVLRSLTDLGFALGHPSLRDGEALFQGLEEFRQHLGGRLTLTMLRGVGDPVDVHEIDEALMRQAIGQLERLDPGPWAGEPLRSASDDDGMTTGRIEVRLLRPAS